jgi:glycosyltransferase involved in cell wall biosynthesis
MRIVLFSHPAFMQSQSMPRFARMLQEAYSKLGHEVLIWTPRARMYACAPNGRFAKWAGYIDQYLLFPVWVNWQLRQQTTDTLFVFADQALGPWVPLVKQRPHVVHVHDLLALRSALGEIPENPTSWTGRIYQRYIRWGFSQARCFVSISHKTQEDLHRVGHVRADVSEVVYNGLNYPFTPIEPAKAVEILRGAALPDTTRGILLHVSGGQWYKNLKGVIAMYGAYAKAQLNPMDLWCVSPPPNAELMGLIERIPNGKVHFLQGLDNSTLAAAYSLARVFVLPSLAEGFGWPIVEAQACGCPVITTDEAPMNEIGGSAARYLRKLATAEPIEVWAASGAELIAEVAQLSPDVRARLVSDGITNAARFKSDMAISEYLRVYSKAMEVARYTRLHT